MNLPERVPDESADVCGRHSTLSESSHARLPTGYTTAFERKDTLTFTIRGPHPAIVDGQIPDRWKEVGEALRAGYDGGVIDTLLLRDLSCCLSALHPDQPPILLVQVRGGPRPATCGALLRPATITVRDSELIGSL